MGRGGSKLDEVHESGPKVIRDLGVSESTVWDWSPRGSGPGSFSVTVCKRPRPSSTGAQDHSEAETCDRKVFTLKWNEGSRSSPDVTRIIGLQTKLTTLVRTGTGIESPTSGLERQLGRTITDLSSDLSSDLNE